MSANAIVVIGASAGGIDPLRHITEALPHDCGASIFVVMHTGKMPSSLPEILRWHGRFAVAFAQNGTLIRPGHIYVAPPDQHMLLMANYISLKHSLLVHHTRPAIDPLFISAAEAFGSRVIGIILSGSGTDGAAGLVAIKQNGGHALVQDPEEAQSSSMPAAAIAADAPECLSIDAIVRRVKVLCSIIQGGEPTSAKCA